MGVEHPVIAHIWLVVPGGGQEMFGKSWGGTGKYVEIDNPSIPIFSLTMTTGILRAKSPDTFSSIRFFCCGDRSVELRMFCWFFSQSSRLQRLKKQIFPMITIPSEWDETTRIFCILTKPNWRLQKHYRWSKPWTTNLYKIKRVIFLQEVYSNYCWCVLILSHFLEIQALLLRQTQPSVGC